MSRVLPMVLLLLVASVGRLAQAQSAPGPGGAVPTVVVTGANRGLGLAWATKYAQRGWNVVATARRPDEARDLAALAQQTGRVRIEMLDATDPASVDAFGARLEGVPVDILVNNAGTIGEEDEQRFGKLDPARFDHYMRVNALSALLVTERLLPNLRQGRQKKVAGISARVASFAAYPRIHSGLYYYKASKAALNMFLRNIALDVKQEGIAVAVLPPGVVNTYGTPDNHEAMSPEMRRSMVDIDTSVAGMMKVLDGLTPDGSGRWYRFSGEVLEW